MVLSNIIPVYADTFADTNQHWARQQIQKTSENGFMGGYPDGTFKPNEEVSYGMTFTVIDRVFSNFNDRYSNSLSQEELADFGYYIDNLLDYLTEKQRDSKTDYPNLPQEMLAFADGWLAALDKDIKNFENFKATYGYTIDKNFADEGKKAFLNDLNIYKFFNDNYDEYLSLLEAHRNKLKEELDQEDYYMQYDYLSSSDPGILFLGSLGRFIELRELGYDMFVQEKIYYFLQTGDLSAEEKNDWKKRSIDYTKYHGNFSIYESEPVQSNKHYAYNHYINMLYASDRHSGYSYLNYPDGWYEDFKNMDFEKSISRDALFSLINRLLLGVSKDYKESYNLFNSNDGESEYVETNYLEPADIEALLATNLLGGSGDGTGNAKLNLNKSLTRAELSTMANRVYEYLEKHK